MCKVQIEPVLQDITGKQLSRRTNKAPEARLDIRARGFWERQRSAFFDVRVCHPNADLYQDLEPHQIYECCTKTRRSLYMGERIEIEHGTFTPLVFTTTGGMGKECSKYPNRLAELISTKEQESYAKTISWIRAKNSLSHY